MSNTTQLSIQLHSLRALESVDLALDAAAAAGFRLVEPVGMHLANPEEMRGKLDDRGLQAPSCHIQMELLREDPARIARACRLIGADYLFVPAVPPEERDAPADRWPAIGRELGALANHLADEGITFGYHNHYEVSIGDGVRTALDMIFEESEGTPLVWQADVAWLARCGKSPADLLRRYRHRLVSLHVKDGVGPFKGDPEDNWRVAGSGDMGWQDLWPVAVDFGAQLMVMEHDRPIDATRFAHEAFKAGQTLGDLK